MKLEKLWEGPKIIFYSLWPKEAEKEKIGKETVTVFFSLIF